MLNILAIIWDWIKDMLRECIKGNLSGMFDSVNDKIGAVAADVGTSPADWNPGIFSMIRTLSHNVIIPIAGMVLAFVLCYELISMLTEKNNMHDFETYNLYKWAVKSVIAIYLVTHTFDITMAIFDVGQHVVRLSAGLTAGRTSVDFAAALGDIDTQLQAMEMGELLGLLVETTLLKITVPALSICIMLVVVSRMIEIYIYCSVGPIPFATMINREWGQMGNNYLRGLVALGLQGFFIMICVAIYSVLVAGIGSGDSIHGAIWKCAGYTAVLCFTLFKTGAVSKALFNAH